MKLNFNYNSMVSGHGIKFFLKKLGIDATIKKSNKGIYAIRIRSSTVEMWDEVERYSYAFKVNKIFKVPSKNYRDLQEKINKYIIENGGLKSSFYFHFDNINNRSPKQRIWTKF